MEKLTSTSCNFHNSAAATTTTDNSSATVDSQDYVPSPPTPLPNDHHYYNQDIANDYSSIFQPYSSLPHSLSLTPSSCSSMEDLRHNFDLTCDAIATEHRLNQARLLLEYQQLCDHFDLCFARLQVMVREVEKLGRENADLRLANADLIRLLSMCSSRATVNGGLRNEEASDLNAKMWERRNGNAPQMNSLPKSVSVRSGSYLKLKQQQGSGNNQQKVVNPVRVYVPSGARREKAKDLEVYNQGMVKTELCNKWQESGTCPYGSHCQFAHGINELRPIVRHPRYKTEVCRMVLANQTCPYGHRCHYRHSLTDQERLLFHPR